MNLAITKDFLEKYNQKYSQGCTKSFNGVCIADLGRKDLINLCNYLIDMIFETELNLDVRIRRIENESGMSILDK